MKIISLFNNKGGVGKTTLAYHMSCALAVMGYRTLMIDMDPQCNMTICAYDTEALHEIWKSEDGFIDEGFELARSRMSTEEFNVFNERPHTIHYLLKPTEDGAGDLDCLPPPVVLNANLDLLPGRLTLHMYENKISERWNSVYTGDPLAIKTITRLRKIAVDYVAQYKYDYVVIDTSPSLGILNKTIISTVDGFIIPCFPDMFSLYGIRNIGRSLEMWRKEFDIIYSLISNEKRKSFPESFVQFLGYTIYNAKRYEGARNKYGLAAAHFGYVEKIPETIKSFISPLIRTKIPFEMLTNPIGETSVMYSHNTFPSMAQKYHHPMWELPSCGSLEEPEKSTIIGGSRNMYLNTKDSYVSFVESLLSRTAYIGD